MAIGGKHQEPGIYHSVKLYMVAMSVMLGDMLGEGAYNPQVRKGGQAIERQKNGPDSKSRNSTRRRRKGVRRNGMGARTTSRSAPDTVFRITLAPEAVGGEVPDEYGFQAV